MHAHRSITKKAKQDKQKYPLREHPKPVVILWK